MPTDDDLEALITRGAPQPSPLLRERVLAAAYAARAARRQPRVRGWALAAAIAVACDVGYTGSTEHGAAHAAPIAHSAPNHDAVALAALVARLRHDIAVDEAAP